MADVRGGAPCALVTGASDGIGEAFARELASRGHDLALVARREPRLERLAAELRAAHGTAVHVLAEDLVDPGAPARLLERLGEARLEVDLLVNNAGIGSDGRPFVDTPLDVMLRMVDLHCRATLELTHRLLPPMLRRGAGGVIFTSSVAAFQPTPNYAVYGATKAFDLLVAEALWAELRGSGVEVLALAPGRTDTGFFEASGRAGAGRGSMSPGRVAREALERLGRGPVHVPGWTNRLMTWIPRVTSRALIARTLARVLGERGAAERGTTGRSPAERGPAGRDGRGRESSGTAPTDEGDGGNG